MKIIYSILILIFIVVAVFCFREFFSASSAQTPLEKDSRQLAGTDKAPRKKVMPAVSQDIGGHGISELLDSNIFEIDRGISPEQRQSPGGEVSMPGKELFTLTGVYKFCGVKGAIIIKRVPSASPRQRGFNRNPAAAAVKEKEKEKENSIKNFFKLGDEVGHGYTLSVVDVKSVTLKKDSEDLVLTINDVKDIKEKADGQVQQPGMPPPMPPMQPMQRMDDMRPLRD